MTVVSKVSRRPQYSMLLSPSLTLKRSEHNEEPTPPYALDDMFKLDPTGLRTGFGLILFLVRLVGGSPFSSLLPPGECGKLPLAALLGLVTRTPLEPSVALKEFGDKTAGDTKGTPVSKEMLSVLAPAIFCGLP